MAPPEEEAAVAEKALLALEAAFDEEESAIAEKALLALEAACDEEESAIAEKALLALEAAMDEEESAIADKALLALEAAMDEAIEEAAQPWPTSKFEKAKATADLEDGKTPAVVMASGSLCLTNNGHVQMLRQAKERLERAGYLVLGGWLSLTDVQAGDPDLSVAFRKRIAELCVAEDDFVSISNCDDKADPFQAMKKLSQYLRERYESWLDGKKIRTFFVCGCSMAKKDGMMTRCCGNPEVGMVICPCKHTQEILLEKPQMFVLVADEPAEDADPLRDLNSVTLLQAVKKRDLDYISKAMPSAAARLILAPTKEQHQNMKADYDVLRIPMGGPTNPWPMEKWQSRLTIASDANLPALIVVSASMSPIHRGHLSLAKQACERLSRAGYVVMAGWISPANQVVAEESVATLSSPFRLRAAELAVCSDDFLAFSDFELAAEGRPPSAVEVLADLQFRVNRIMPESSEGEAARVFLVCDPAEARRRGLNQNFSKRFAGVVVVPQPNDECFMMEKPSNQFFVADPPPADQADLFDVGRLRAAISSGDIAHVARVLPSATARLIMHPTPEEVATMEADFKQLGVAAVASAGAEGSRDKLKDSFRTWAGPAGTIPCSNVARLLKLLDPSWTSAELDKLQPLASGSISCDELIDWIFANCA